MENRDAPPHEVSEVHLRCCGGRGGGLLDCRSSSRTGRPWCGDSWCGSGRSWSRRIARAGSWCTGRGCETTIDRGRARCWCTGCGSRAGGRCGSRWSWCPPRRWCRSTGSGSRAGCRGWWRRPRSLVSAGYPFASSRWGRNQRAWLGACSRSRLATSSGTPSQAVLAMHSQVSVGTRSGTSGFTTIRRARRGAAKMSELAG